MRASRKRRGAGALPLVAECLVRVVAQRQWLRNCSSPRLFCVHLTKRGEPRACQCWPCPPICPYDKRRSVA
jgi:hypothetical protein